MLGCSVELLTQCLTQKSVETSREVVLTPLSASDVREMERERERERWRER